VDQAVLDRTAAKFKEDGTPIQTYQDIRKLLENPDIDAVSFATPNHWHALGAIWAVQAGKDVYLEKPVSHNVWEGRKIVEAARKHNRLVQAGTQTRSSYGIREAIAWLRAGNLGKPTLGRALCYNRRDSIGKATEPCVIPATVDYDLWCGPAPKEKELWRKKFHYDWHWVWPTGNGDLGNQGVHQVDMVRWALGYNELSPRVFSLGGRFGYDDDGTTPNTQIVFHDYQLAPIIFEVRGLPTTDKSDKMDTYRGYRGVSGVVECEGGFLVMPNYTTAIACDKDGKEIKKFEGADNHYGNFIKAVRSRKQSDLNADILEGHLSAGICHTGNISYQLGKPQSPEAIRDTIKNDPTVADAFGRMEQHLAANNVDLHKTPAALGVVLNMDPKTERFTNNAGANQRLTREYRQPFVVPEKV
jgi:predicted dehydrogenase